MVLLKVSLVALLKQDPAIHGDVLAHVPQPSAVLWQWHQQY
jgi:hypothetical protein